MLEQSKTYTMVEAGIQQLAEEFVETGIATLRGIDYSDIPYDDWAAKLRRHRQLSQPLASIPLQRSFIRRVAKDLKRPIVFAETNGWQGKRALVTIKRIKRNAPLVAHFLLTLSLTARGRLPYERAEKSPVIEAASDETNWYIRFNKAEGLREFYSWLAFVKTDPACRTALKLQPLTQGSNHDAPDLDDRDPCRLRHEGQRDPAAQRHQAARQGDQRHCTAAG